MPERLDGAALEAAVGGVDVVLDGTDNFTTRFAVNRACVARGVPLVSGAAVRVEGQIAVFPNRGDGPCYACLYNDEDEWLGDCQGNGVLAPVPGVIGTLMAQEALKLVLGWDSALHDRLLLWDAQARRLAERRAEARSGLRRVREHASASCSSTARRRTHRRDRPRTPCRVARERPDPRAGRSFSELNFFSSSVAMLAISMSVSSPVILPASRSTASTRNSCTVPSAVTILTLSPAVSSPSDRICC